MKKEQKIKIRKLESEQSRSVVVIENAICDTFLKGEKFWDIEPLIINKKDKYQIAHVLWAIYFEAQRIIDLRYEK